ncbi:ABC transporter substrate-binding protein [Aliihoeflea sp. PC F10.4]
MSKWFATIALAFVATPVAAQETVKVGAVDSLTNAPLYIAEEKGYYEEEGLNVEMLATETSGDVALLLATNQIQITGGGVGPTFFNSISQNMPISMLISRNVSPFDHYVVARPEVAEEIKEPADLKGRKIALNATGSIVVYEMARVLESAGLSLDDIEISYLPFSQMPPALTTGAVDAVVMISPQFDSTHASGIGVKTISVDQYMEPQPVVISFLQMNTDWAASNEEAARAFTRATLRATRDYCDAYHGAKNRAEIVEILSRRSGIDDIDFIDNVLEWQQLDPAGRVYETSIMDVQAFFADRGQVENPATWEQMEPPAWVAEEAEALGAYTPPAGSDKAGCTLD